jgi:site-specific DNA-cytosine methylase
MNVLIGCEFSGVVRDAFAAKGHDAWSCDIKSAEGQHLKCDIYKAFPTNQWHLIILHPPCTALCVAGNRHYAGTDERAGAIEWTRHLFETASSICGKVAMENPVGVLSSAWRKPDQYIQPWEYGHGETKKTGLWLHNLPKLRPSNIVEGREQRIWRMAPSPDRGAKRSITYAGIAAAMAEQWG